MTRTLVDRAARALFRARTADLPRQDALPALRSDWDNLEPELQEGFVLDIRAVLQAIREPSKGMIDAMAETAQCTAEDVSALWQAMIDAAMREGAGRLLPDTVK